jgi:hypothetical protein
VADSPGTIHPVAFFGLDLFKFLLDALLKFEDAETQIVNPFPFVAIDEIQVSVESVVTQSLPGSSNIRPFFHHWYITPRRCIYSLNFCCQALV